LSSAQHEDRVDPSARPELRTGILPDRNRPRDAAADQALRLTQWFAGASRRTSTESPRTDGATQRKRDKPHQCVVANTLSLFCNGAVGFIDWLGCGAFSPVPTEKQLRNATKRQGANDCSGADPLPPGWSKRQEPEPITEGSNSAKNEKWPGKAAVNPSASGSVE
jgi:hypothetical protein